MRRLYSANVLHMSRFISDSLRITKKIPALQEHGLFTFFTCFVMHCVIVSSQTQTAASIVAHCEPSVMPKLRPPRPAYIPTAFSLTFISHAMEVRGRSSVSSLQFFNMSFSDLNISSQAEFWAIWHASDALDSPNICKFARNCRSHLCLRDLSNSVTVAKGKRT